MIILLYCNIIEMAGNTKENINIQIWIYKGIYALLTVKDIYEPIQTATTGIITRFSGAYLFIYLKLNKIKKNISTIIVINLSTIIYNPPLRQHYILNKLLFQ